MLRPRRLLKATSSTKTVCYTTTRPMKSISRRCSWRLAIHSRGRTSEMSSATWETSSNLWRLTAAPPLCYRRARHWFNLGVSLYSSRRHLAEAVESFRHALHLNDAFASAHYSLAVALVEAGKRADAHGHYEKAIAIEPHTMVSAAAT